MKNLGILKRGNVCLIIIDVQERFRPVIFEMDRVIENTVKLAKAFNIFGIPIIVTEQNPEKLGKTVDEIRWSLLEYRPIEKLHFSCFGEEEFVKALKKHDVTQLVLCGIESHVCVLKTAIDAIRAGYEVHVAYDAISSRNIADWEIAKNRFVQSGAYVTTAESIIFQLMEFAGTEEFRKIMDIVK